MFTYESVVTANAIVKPYRTMAMPPMIGLGILVYGLHMMGANEHRSSNMAEM